MNDIEEKLFIENKNLIHFTIRKMDISSYYWLTYDDLYQIGSIGLLNAIRKFNSSNGTSFSSYAITCIKNFVIYKLSGLCKKDPLNFCDSLNWKIEHDDEETELINLIADEADNYSHISDHDWLLVSVNELCDKYKIIHPATKEKTFNIIKDYIVYNIPQVVLCKKYKLSSQRISKIIENFKIYCTYHINKDSLI